MVRVVKYSGGRGIALGTHFDLAIRSKLKKNVWCFRRCEQRSEAGGTGR